MQERKRKIVIAVICFILFVASFIAFNPGFLTPDGLDQYEQALAGVYADWHPPLMAFAWRQLNHIYQGPEVMLVLQLLFLWTGIYFLATTIKSRCWYISLVIFALAPFVLNFAGNIFKDTQMALAWLLAFSLLFHTVLLGKRPGFIVLAISLILILYGTWLRPNALPGSVSLLCLWAWVATAHKSKNVFTITFALLIVFTVAGTFLFTGRIFNASKQYAQNKLFMHDMAGIFIKTGENVFPAVLYNNPKFDTAYLRKSYIPATFDFIWWNNDDKDLRPAKNDETAKAVKDAWVNAIKKHPDVYFKNKLDGFLYFLRVKKRTDIFFYSSPWVLENPYGFHTKGRGFHEAVFTHVDMHKNMPYMTPWFWFFLNILLLPLIFMIKNKRMRVLYAALVLSSIAYVLPQFFIYQIDTEFRYMYWNCIACTVAVCMLIVPRKNAINKNEEGATTPSSLS